MSAIFLIFLQTMGALSARLSVLCVVILLLIALLRRWRLPYLVAYILAGLVLGPGVAGLFTPGEGPAMLGEFGILLLMFFLGLDTGRLVLNILLLQDVLVAPVFAFLQWIGRSSAQWGTLAASAVIAVGLFFLLRAIRNRDIWNSMGWRILEDDHDLQVFFGALCCLGCSCLSSLAGLPAPIGSFAAGLWLGRARGLGWLGTVLKPFKVFFVALYFVSVGLMIDLRYIADHWLSIVAITEII